AKPIKKHLKEVKRIFCYLQGTINTGLWYTKDSGFELTRFSDADYAGCKDTFKSTPDGAQFLVEKLTDYQLADIFTKALPANHFNYLVRCLGMRRLSLKELEHVAKSQTFRVILFSIHSDEWKSFQSQHQTALRDGNDKVITYWALKHANFNLKTAGDHQKLQLNELNELRDQAYENSLIYKERTKKLHDSKIKNHIFNVGDRVLLFNSYLKIFLGKLKTRWLGPFTITKVFPYGTVELSQPDGPNFKVNGHRVKHYFGGDVPQLVVPDLQTFPMDK
nr:reverse transcriptase domain-containing protein [Tanacetum cinerariifolium]